MEKYIFALLLMLLTGCAATWTQRRYEPVKGGVVTYRATGLGVSSRKDDAAAKMAEFCGAGGYKIKSETNGSQTAAYAAQGNMLLPLSDTYMNIDFDCN